MVDHARHSNEIDRYLRNELSAEEESAFEQALLESTELQEALEAALALREAIRLDSAAMSSGGGEPDRLLKGTSNWQPFAMAASVLLAIFSTTMFWKVSQESTELRGRVQALNKPYAVVQKISVDIMRSGGNAPDIIIQKPGEHALVLLEIELSPLGQQQSSVHMTMRDESQSDILDWTSSVNGQRVVSVAIPSQDLPEGRVWLELADSEGKIFDRRLLEFLAAKN